MRHKIRTALFGNLWLKLLSLGIGFVIWVMVSNANNPTRTMLFSGVPITIVNQDSVAGIGKVIEPEGNGTVTIKVTAPRSVLQSLSRSGSDFYVEADMETINEMSTVPLSVTCSNSAVTWDRIDMQPASLKVTLEDKTEQTFVASVSADGTPASGFEVGATSIQEGKNILIAGPKSLVNIINQVVAPVNVASISRDTSTTSTLRIYDKNGDTLTDTQLARLEFKDESGFVLTDHSVTVDIDMWRIRTDVPLKVETTGSPAWGYRVSEIETIPETISLVGSDSALEALGSEFVVKDTVDVSGASSEVRAEIDLTHTLSEMEELRLISDADPTVQVDVRIEQNFDVTLYIPLSAVSFANRPQNRTLVITPADEIPVKVHALEENAPQLSAADLTLKVDLSACEKEGSYELPVEVTLPEGYELAADVTIRVVSGAQEEQTEAG